MQKISLLSRGVMVGVGIIGVVCIMPAQSRLHESFILSKVGKHVNAEVLGVGVHNIDQGGTSGKVSRRVYQWRIADENGNNYEFSSQHQYPQWFESYNEDGTMPIVYDPNEVGMNRVDTWFNRWGRDAAITIFFFPLIWLGVLSLLPEFLIVMHRNFWERVFRKNKKA